MDGIAPADARTRRALRKEERIGERGTTVFPSAISLFPPPRRSARRTSQIPRAVRLRTDGTGRTGTANHSRGIPTGFRLAAAVASSGAAREQCRVRRRCLAGRKRTTTTIVAVATTTGRPRLAQSSAAFRGSRELGGIRSSPSLRSSIPALTLSRHRSRCDLG